MRESNILKKSVCSIEEVYDSSKQERLSNVRRSTQNVVTAGKKMAVQLAWGEQGTTNGRTSSRKQQKVKLRLHLF